MLQIRAGSGCLDAERADLHVSATLLGQAIPPAARVQLVVLQLLQLTGQHRVLCLPVGQR